MFLQTLLSAPRVINGFSPVFSFLVIYIVSMIYMFRSRNWQYRLVMALVNLLMTWGIFMSLSPGEVFNRYLDFTTRDGLLFYLSSFLVIVIGGIYFGLLREIRKPDNSFRFTHSITSMAGLCAVFTLMLLIEIASDPTMYYPFFTAPEFIAMQSVPG